MADVTQFDERYIMRKEYDEKSIAILVSLTKTTEVLASQNQLLIINQKQIDQLARDVQKILISEAQQKYLWPIITTLSAILAGFIGHTVF